MRYDVSWVHRLELFFYSHTQASKHSIHCFEVVKPPPITVSNYFNLIFQTPSSIHSNNTTLLSSTSGQTWSRHIRRMYRTMYIRSILLLALAALTGLTSAHMEMIDPPALLTKGNRNTGQPTTESYDMKGPLSADGANFPCKGTLKALGTSQGSSVATWQAGSRQTWTLEGSTTHGGGSCQASISTDQGRSFKVVHSYIGGCPLKLSWDFKVPNDTPQGPALFAFSWNNRGGNRVSIS